MSLYFGITVSTYNLCLDGYESLMSRISMILDELLMLPASCWEC